MCLLVAAYRCHPEFPLIVAANRDEFFRRPAAAADYWNDHPDVLAGRDLEHGGTWMGVSKYGRFAALTNVRDPKYFRNVAKSRGVIVAKFLFGDDSPKQYLENLAQESDDFNGFNLIVGTTDELYYFNSVTKKTSALGAGIHGLSNDQLDTPWPKVIRAKNNMALALRQNAESLENPLFSMLRDNTVAPDSDLPDTGVGLEKERWLSPIFIRTNEYGTRCSTLLLARRDGEIQYIERSFDTASEAQSLRRFSFAVAANIAP